MSRIIKDLPDEFDPVEIISKKMRTCPICGTVWDCDPYGIGRVFPEHKHMDKNGKYHKYRKSLNKYEWDRYANIKCKNCGCKWDTGWYPADHEMFSINISNDEISNYEVMLESFERVMKKLGIGDKK